MKRRYLHYDPVRKVFVPRSARTIPYLLDPHQERLLRFVEAKQRELDEEKRSTPEILMNWITAYNL